MMAPLLITTRQPFIWILKPRQGLTSSDKEQLKNWKVNPKEDNDDEDWCVWLCHLISRFNHFETKKLATKEPKVWVWVRFYLFWTIEDILFLFWHHAINRKGRGP